jgi:NADH:ubiquinone oxidoreductase subunit D
MERGALTAMTNGFRARERCLDVLELITGLRMYHAYVRPGGIAQDLPDGTVDAVRQWIKQMHTEADRCRSAAARPTDLVNRLKDVGWLGVEGCLALGVTGPMLRAAGLPWDLRQDRAVPRLRHLRLRRAHQRPGRLLVTLRGPGGRDAQNHCASSSRPSIGSNRGRR